MINFASQQCLFKDKIGFNYWLAGHHYEHTQFINLCQNLTSPISLPVYDFRSWFDDKNAVQAWLQNHEYVHKILRQVCNLTGDDLSLVDFNDENQWYSWMDNHATEHQSFEQYFGMS